MSKAASQVEESKKTEEEMQMQFAVERSRLEAEAQA